MENLQALRLEDEDHLHAGMSLTTSRNGVSTGSPRPVRSTGLQKLRLK
jgi:hypothetical protein